MASALRSIPTTNPALALDVENKIVFTRAQEPGHVAIISGGGAGHEPSFVSYSSSPQILAGCSNADMPSFVGAGLLRAAVSGTIFASPSVRQIHHAITRRVAPNAGVLLIVMNYTGDVLHFGLASEKAAAAGIAVELVVVADDVGVGRAKNGKVGRRGIAGTVLVHKIAGALAAAGGGLREVAELARLVAAGLVSVGSSLGHVHVPGHPESSGEHEAALKGDEIEVGMGIHNEQGFKRMKIPELGELVRLLLAQLLDKEDKDRNYLEDVEKSEGWVLMVNNLGGISPLEMGGITTEVVEQLGRSFRPRHVKRWGAD